MMWVYRLGPEPAKRFLSGGDAIDAETAHRIGLVSPVCWARGLGLPLMTMATSRWWRSSPLWIAGTTTIAKTGGSRLNADQGSRFNAD